MNNTNDLATRKTTLRRQLKAVRSGIPAETRREYSQQIAERLFSLEEVRSANTVFVYISYATEVETHEIIKRLLEERKLVTVPYITDSSVMLAHRLNEWDQLQPGQLGILAPTGSQQYTGNIDIAITPGLGFTLQGNRIGFGAGYYDRWFASHSARRKIALAFEAQIVDDLPLEETDVPVNLIVSESRIIQTS